MVTKGNSFVNDTINYTTQPSLNANGNRIFNSTLSLPLSRKLNTDIERFHEHRFDVATDTNVQYMLDGKLMHSDSHHTPTHDMGGNLQMKLWSDGNRWWSGYPSSKDVTMSIKSIIAYYNTSSPETSANKAWVDACTKAGGPGNDTICRAFAKAGKNDDIPLSGKGKAGSTTKEDVSTKSDTSTTGDKPTSAAIASTLYTEEPTACFDLKCRQTVVGQALRVQPPGVGLVKRYLGSLTRLPGRYQGTLGTSDATSSRKASPVISARQMYSTDTTSTTSTNTETATTVTTDTVTTTETDTTTETCASCSTASSTSYKTIDGTYIPTDTPCFDKKCMQPSQPSRTQSPLSRLISRLPTWHQLTGWLARRDDVVYRLPGGSPVHVDDNGQPVKSAAVRGRAPPWFFTDYTALFNSTRLTHKS